MIFAIDHIVFSATLEDKRSLSARLLESGFVDPRFKLDFSEIGAASESFAFSGGAFVEFVYELPGGGAPKVWFSEVPRVIGVGFSSNDFVNDIGPWVRAEGSWVMDEDKTLGDGSILNIHAAGPHPHHQEFYVFVMDRDRGVREFEGTEAQARLRRLTIEGLDHDLWRERLERWLRVPRRGEALLVGDVELVFRPGPQAGVHVTPTFEVSENGGEIPLARGSLELVQRSTLDD